MIDLPTFDEVHVVSDLHMGGVAGFQVFREAARLTNFIGRLASRRPDVRSALVLNGDIFDTLAEDMPGCIASDDAVAVVGRILRDASFAPVWQALGAFVRSPGRTLVLVIGNHDLELALPAVQRLLVTTLASEDPAARGRIEFSTVGAGFACRVGACRVFCTHGNEVDGWNYNRYEDLATLARRISAGRKTGPADWRPNAGSRMVREVMNDIKRRFAWIDLLKPETSAAVGALLVLDPAQMTKVAEIAGLVRAQRRGTREARQRLLTADRRDPALPGLDLRLFGPNLRRLLMAPDDISADEEDLLAIAERRLDEPSPALGGMPAFGAMPALGAIAERSDLLGLPQLGWDWLHGIAPAEALRHALLDWLADDKSFDADAADDTSRRICASVDPAVDFVIAGHTHLERAIDRGDGRAYFNTGTWMRLLRLSPPMLASRQAFEPVWQVLADGSMAAIDAARFEGEPFVPDRSSAVTIRREVDADDRGGEQVVSEQVVSEQVVSEQVVSEQVVSEQVVGGQVVGGQVAGGQVAGEQVVGELLHIEGDGSGEPRPVRRFIRRLGA